MKTKQSFSKWCKNTLMLLPVVAMLTFMSCQKDDLLSGALPETGALLQSTSLARAGAGSTYIIDFESVPTSLLAGPTSYGENLYYGYTPQYTGYTDAATGLYMGINPTGMWSSDPNFYNGGIAISQWNDMVMPGDSNQCSVYYSDPLSGNGGYNDSETFAVHFGYNEPMYMGDTRSYIMFNDTSRRCIFNEFYVNNSTYAYLAMRDGYFVADSLTYANQGWFKLVIEGLDGSGNVTASDTVYLADFRTPTSPGIMKDWTWVDLSPLGAVNAIRFDMQGSDSSTYGLNTPAYFCFDNLSVTLLN
jgi:hypothetical protein